MRSVFLLSLFVIALASSCGTRYRLSSTELTSDSSHVYALPYPKGENHFLIQGYNSWFSHKGRLGLDFKMKKGSDVAAARDGVVVGLQEDFTKGGVHKKYYRRSNYITVRHRDGSQAFYGHLLYKGVLVNIGDTVRTGQVIGLSGSTGYSALPHLHFMVWSPSAQGRRQQPTRFSTSKGVLYLRPGSWYK
jgi:murein DD-endopeptidase MepM/ murein hydrolase activator NlpD